VFLCVPLEVLDDCAWRQLFQSIHSGSPLRASVPWYGRL